MNNEIFRQREHLETLLEKFSEEFDKHTEMYKSDFLSLDAQMFKEDSIDPEIHRKNFGRLATLLRNLYFTKDKGIIQHFENLGFRGLAEKIFLSKDEIFTELKNIHSRNIIFLDYFNVITYFITYMDMKIYCVLLTRAEEKVQYSDRELSSVKHEIEIMRKRIKSNPKSKENSFFIKFLNEENLHGQTRKDLINNMHDGKYDPYFFKQGFSTIISPVDKGTPENKYLPELYNLFRIVTKNAKFITKKEFEERHGYDSFEQYQTLMVKRLLYDR